MRFLRWPRRRQTSGVVCENLHDPNLPSKYRKCFGEPARWTVTLSRQKRTLETMVLCSKCTNAYHYFHATRNQGFTVTWSALTEAA